MKVWKWKIPRQAKFTLAMPGGTDAQVVFIASDGDDGFLWALVNPNSQERERAFERYTTGGGDISAHARHLGSYRDNDGFVAHIFEGQS